MEPSPFARAGGEESAGALFVAGVTLAVAAGLVVAEQRRLGGTDIPKLPHAPGD